MKPKLSSITLMYGSREFLLVLHHFGL